MAGVKGKSGGARPNSGGARPGAGRKPKPPAAVDYDDPLEFLRQVWCGKIKASPDQVRAASAALSFLHPKKAPAGKVAPAAPVIPDKYAARTGPRLVSSK